MTIVRNVQVFAEVAYNAKSREDLLAGIDEFIDDLTVLPPSIWESSVRLEPPSTTRSMVGHLVLIQRSCFLLNVCGSGMHCQYGTVQFFCYDYLTLSYYFPL